MRVRLTTNVMLNSAHRAAGAVVEVDDATGQRLLSRGYASSSLEPAPQPVDRVAALEAENAELREKLKAAKPAKAPKPASE
jgi:hypothetical protein